MAQTDLICPKSHSQPKSSCLVSGLSPRAQTGCVYCMAGIWHVTDHGWTKGPKIAGIKLSHFQGILWFNFPCVFPYSGNYRHRVTLWKTSDTIHYNYSDVLGWHLRPHWHMMSPHQDPTQVHSELLSQILCTCSCISTVPPSTGLLQGNQEQYQTEKI